jgi:hypothetical protein
MVSNEDFKQEDITPEMLGCMGEQEVDEGVKEPTEPIKSQPTTKDEIFASIPHETKKAFKKLYDGFEKKDMPFDEFCVEMMMMSNPGVMQSTLSKIMDRKQQGYMHKAAIDSAIKTN